MDAAEQVPLQTGWRVSWLRIADECSGGVLWTDVFPPRPLERGPAAGGPAAVAVRLYPLGLSRAAPYRQWGAAGLGRRSADRPGVVVDRPGGGDGLEPAAAAAGQWRDRAVAGDGQAVGRAVHLCQCHGPAAPLGGDGRYPAWGVPQRAGPQSGGGVPAIGPLGPGVFDRLGAEALELDPGGGASGRLRGAAAGGSLRVGVVVQPESLCRCNS